jgi:hypothetical protein
MSKQVRTIELEGNAPQQLALIGSDDSVWVVVHIAWWNLAMMVWWFFAPFDKKAYVLLTTVDGTKYRAKAFRMANRFIRVRMGQSI